MPGEPQQRRSPAELEAAPPHRCTAAGGRSRSKARRRSPTAAPLSPEPAAGSRRRSPSSISWCPSARRAFDRCCYLTDIRLGGGRDSRESRDSSTNASGDLSDSTQSLGGGSARIVAVLWVPEISRGL
nr:hypothetical protein Iba_chr04eCG19480 [Ipomoea batatas]